MPPLNIRELIPNLNIPQGSGNTSDTFRSSHVRTHDIHVLDISSIPPLEKVTSSRDRRLISENISIVQHYPHGGSQPQ